MRWVRMYTSGLPESIAARRMEEIDADLHEQIAYEKARGEGDTRTAIGVLSRMARGIPADISWRHHLRPLKGAPMKPFVALFALAMGAAALALVFDAPLLILLSVGLIGAGVVGALGLALRDASRRDFVVPFVGMVVAAVAIAALGVGAIVIGERGDAPGLVLFGIAVIVSVIAGAYQIGVRTAQRSS
jgi:hypothetical protein